MQQSPLAEESSGTLGCQLATNCVDSALSQQQTFTALQAFSGYNPCGVSYVNHTILQKCTVTAARVQTVDTMLFSLLFFSRAAWVQGNE